MDAHPLVLLKQASIAQMATQHPLQIVLRYAEMASTWVMSSATTGTTLTEMVAPRLAKLSLGTLAKEAVTRLKTSATHNVATEFLTQVSSAMTATTSMAMDAQPTAR